MRNNLTIICRLSLIISLLPRLGGKLPAGAKKNKKQTNRTRTICWRRTYCTNRRLFCERECVCVCALSRCTRFSWCCSMAGYVISDRFHSFWSMIFSIAALHTQRVPITYNYIFQPWNMFLVAVCSLPFFVCEAIIFLFLSVFFFRSLHIMNIVLPYFFVVVAVFVLLCTFCHSFFFVFFFFWFAVGKFFHFFELLQE